MLPATEPMKTSDCGAVYHRWIDNKGMGGSPPSRNASRAPGEWQSFDVVFLSPVVHTPQVGKQLTSLYLKSAGMLLVAR